MVPLSFHDSAKSLAKNYKLLLLYYNGRLKRKIHTSAEIEGPRDGMLLRATDGMSLNAALGAVEGRSEGVKDGSELEFSDGIELN